MEQSSVFSTANRFIMVYALALLKAGENIGFFIFTFWRNQNGNWFADDFLRGVTKQTCGARIPTGDNTCQILGDNGIIGELNDCRKKPECVLRSALFQGLAIQRLCGLASGFCFDTLFFSFPSLLKLGNHPIQSS